MRGYCKVHLLTQTYLKMDVNCWEDIGGHIVGPHHQSLMWNRRLLSPSLCSNGRVYQHRPEYLIGKRVHPWDLICTGVHLVYTVYDNLHIMLHLHPTSSEQAFFFFLPPAACESPATLEAGNCLQTLQRRPVCVALIRKAVNAAQLCKDLACLQLFVGSAQFV